MCGNCRITQLTKGEKGDNGATAFKFVKKITSSGDGDEVIITRAEITACGPTPVGCMGAGTVSNPFTDLHIQVQIKVGGGWLIQPIGVVSISTTTTKRIDVIINETTGNLTLVFSYVYTIVPDEYRIIILA
jgi:hypothetical protein